MLDRIEQHHDSQCTFRNRHEDPEQNDKIVGAVDTRRLLQTFRDLRERSAHNDQVPCIDSHRQNQCQACIVQPYVVDRQIKGDQAAGKIHCEHDGLCKYASIGKPFARQNIRAHAAEDDVHKRSRADIKNSVCIACPNAGGLQHHSVSIQGKPFGSEQDSRMRDQLCGVTEGSKQDIQHWVCKNHGENAHQQDVEYVKDPFRNTAFHYHPISPHHKLFSVIFLLNVFASHRNPKFTTELNRPTAVLNP